MHGVDGKLLNDIKSCYVSEVLEGKKQKMVTGFSLERGLRQGCGMSLWLFNIFYEWGLEARMMFGRKGDG